MRALTVLRDAVGAKIAELEAEGEEEREKVERLRVAQLAAPRKRTIYFLIAELLITGGGSELILPWLRTPEILRRTANALEIAEKGVDRAGLKVVKSFLTALRTLQAGPPKLTLREAYKTLKLEDVQREYRKLYPGHRVPGVKSLGRTLNRKELWRGKSGRPFKKGDKSA